MYSGKNKNKNKKRESLEPSQEMQLIGKINNLLLDVNKNHEDIKNITVEMSALDKAANDPINGQSLMDGINQETDIDLRNNCRIALSIFASQQRLLNNINSELMLELVSYKQANALQKFEHTDEDNGAAAKEKLLAIVQQAQREPSDDPKGARLELEVCDLRSEIDQLKDVIIQKDTDCRKLKNCNEQLKKENSSLVEANKMYSQAAKAKVNELDAGDAALKEEKNFLRAPVNPGRINVAKHNELGKGELIESFPQLFQPQKSASTDIKRKLYTPLSQEELEKKKSTDPFISALRSSLATWNSEENITTRKPPKQN